MQNKIKITRTFSDDPEDHKKAAAALLKALLALQKREQAEKQDKQANCSSIIS